MLLSNLWSFFKWQRRIVIMNNSYHRHVGFSRLCLLGVLLCFVCKLLKQCSLLSDDDQFRDATSHKGCQIRRESAHGETVCRINVRALFVELPTPHLIVGITPFPAGPLTDKDYDKA